MDNAVQPAKLPFCMLYIKDAGYGRRANGKFASAGCKVVVLPGSDSLGNRLKGGRRRHFCMKCGAFE